MKKLQINILAIIACLLWASAFFSGKFCLNNIPPLTLASIRLIIATIMLAFFVDFGEVKALKSEWKTITILGILKTVIIFVTFNMGLSRVSGSLGALIIGMSPAIAIIVAITLLPNEHFTKSKTQSLIIGIIAILMLSFNGNSNGKTQVFGIILLVSNCICAAYADVYIKKKTHIKFSIAVNFLQLAVGALIVTIIALIAEDYKFSNLVSNYQLMIGVTYLAFITAVATTIWMKLVQNKDVELSEIAIWKLIIPSIGAILSWIFSSSDKPTVISIIAMCLILLSITLSQLNNRKKAQLLKVGKRA
jgi:drug/metabolite transporter (DMT)-like permease